MKRFRYLGLIITFMMVLQLVVPMNFASGSTGTDVTNRIDESKTNVEVKIYDGTVKIEPDGDGKYSNVPINAEVVMNYHYWFLNDDGNETEPTPYNYNEGDFFNINFPIDIKFPIFPAAGLELKMGDDVVGILTSDGKVTFTNYVEGRSDVQVEFQIKGIFKEDIINQENPVTITLWADGEIIKIVFTKPDPEPVELDLIKEGTIDATNGEIEWTIKVTPKEGKTATNVTLNDLFSGNLEYINGSLIVNGVATSSGITASSIGLDYAFPGPIQGEQVVVYKTKIKDTTYSLEDSTNNIIKYKNTVKAFIDDVSKGTATKNIDLEWISKSGATADNFQKIKWTVSINNYNGLLKNNGTVIKDILDPNLLFVENDNNFPVKIKLNNSEHVITTVDEGFGRYEIAENKLTYYFNGSSDFTTAVLTYYTEIKNPTATSNDPVTYYNDAEINWGTNITGPSVKASVGIGKGIIQKSASGTNAYYNNDEINWTVLINKNRVKITNATFIDQLPEGVTYKTGTFKINNSLATPTVSGSAIAYELGTITTPQTITYTTRIDNNFKGLFTNNDVKFSNNVSLSGGGITTQTDSATKTVKSQVIDKTVGINYDYDTRIVEWEIAVNKNKIPLNNVIISDVIPAGMEFMPSSFKVNGAVTPLLSDQYIVSNIDNITSQDSFAYPLGNITGEHVITFKTKVKEAYLLDTSNLNKTLGFTNNTKIKADSFTDEISATAKVNVNNYIVTKNGERAGYESVKWSVPINKNEVTLSNIVLTDELQEGLALDLTSVKLYEASVNNTGVFTKGSEVDLINNSDFTIIYDQVTRIFTFKILGETNKAYELEFVTDVLKDSITITNKIKFAGSGETTDYTADSIYVNVNSWTGSGSASNGSLTIIKVDENNEPLSGAEFKVYDKLNKIYEVNTTAVNTMLYNNLPYRIYTIEETKAPNGYLLDKTLKTVKINSATGMELKVANKKALGDIKLIKQTETGAPLSGAEFTLYKNGAEIDGLDPVSSNESGLVIFNGIEPGSYTVKETRAPNGYKVINEDINVEISISSDMTFVEVKYNGELSNEPYVVENELVDVDGDIIINKVDSKGNALKGSKFTLYDVIDSTFEAPIRTEVSDENGKVIFADMDLGTYVIKETKATDGYYKSSDVIIAKITRNANLTHTDIKYKVNDGEFTESIPVIKNESIIVEISKQDASENPLSGAEFTLYNENNAVVQVITSNDFGEVKFENIPIGKYTIKETKSPSRYYKSEDVINVEVKENNNPKGAEVIISVNEAIKEGVVVVVNKRIPGGNIVNYGNIAIKKTDTNKNVMSGAEFTLYDEKGSVIQKGTTGEDGILSFKEVLEGKYTIIETKAPEGYESNNEKLFVTVNKDQTCTLIIENKLKEIIIPIISGSIVINKVDKSSKPLEGAEFTLYNNEKQIIGTAVSDKGGKVQFENLPIGTYYVKETMAPDGYKLVTAEKEVVIVESKTYSFKFKNVLNEEVIKNPDVPMGWDIIDDPDVPQDNLLPEIDIPKGDKLPDTGDLLNTWILAMIGILLILSGIALFKRRKNKIV